MVDRLGTERKLSSDHYAAPYKGDYSILLWFSNQAGYCWSGKT
jgi:hypothetical protein